MVIQWLMVLVYLPTKLADVGRANAAKYSSTMEHMGIFVVVASSILMGLHLQRQL